MIKPAYSFSFLLSINIFVWQNVLYFLDAPRTMFPLAARSVLLRAESMKEITSERKKPLCFNERNQHLLFEGIL